MQVVVRATPRVSAWDAGRADEGAERRCQKAVPPRCRRVPYGWPSGSTPGRLAQNRVRVVGHFGLTSTVRLQPWLHEILLCVQHAYIDCLQDCEMRAGGNSGSAYSWGGISGGWRGVCYVWVGWRWGACMALAMPPAHACDTDATWDLGEATPRTACPPYRK